MCHANNKQIIAGDGTAGQVIENATFLGSSLSDWVELIFLQGLCLLFFLLGGPMRHWVTSMMWTVRDKISLSRGDWSGWEKLNVNAMDRGPSWRLLPLTLSMILAFLIPIYLFDGDLINASNTLVSLLVFTTIAVKFNRRWVVIAARVIMLHQLVTIWSSKLYEDEAMIIRALSKHALGIALFFDPLESLVHSLSVTAVLWKSCGWSNNRVLLLPIRMYFLFILPLSFSGLREWVCSQNIFSGNKLYNAMRRFFIAFSIPLMTILFSYSLAITSASKEQVQQMSLFAKVFGGANFLGALFCILFSDYLNGLFLDQTILDVLATTKHIRNQVQRSSSGGVALDYLDTFTNLQVNVAMMNLPSISDGMIGLTCFCIFLLGDMYIGLIFLVCSLFLKKLAKTWGKCQCGHHLFLDMYSPINNLNPECDHKATITVVILDWDRIAFGLHACALAYVSARYRGLIQERDVFQAIYSYLGLFFPLDVDNTTTSNIHQHQDSTYERIVPVFLDGNKHHHPHYPSLWTPVRSFFRLWSSSPGTASNAKMRAILVLMNTMRLLLAFQRRSFAQVQGQLTILAVISSLLINNDRELVFLMSFISICAVFVTLLVFFSRNEAALFFKREDDSYAFLFHAIKQKFSGVGSAAEQILELPMLTKQSELARLLHNVMEECHQGQDACHVTSVVRNIAQRKFKMMKEYHDIKLMMTLWKNTNILRMKHLVFDISFESDLDLEFDIELLRLFLSQWIGISDRVIVWMTSTSTDSNASINMHIRKESSNIVSIRDGRSLSMILKTLGGSFVNYPTAGPGSVGLAENHEICFSNVKIQKRIRFATTMGAFTGAVSGATFNDTIQSTTNTTTIKNNTSTTSCSREMLSLNSSSSSFSSPTSTSEVSTSSSSNTGCGGVMNKDRVQSSGTNGLQTAPQPQQSLKLELVGLDPNSDGVTFAILDDNLLVRRNLERIIKSINGIDATRVVCVGGTLQESLTFADFICESRAQVAIIDENLEYGDKHLSGTELARLARRKGFKGCAVLHSASEINNLDTCFDGLVEKTTSKVKLIDGIQKAITLALKRQQQRGGTKNE